VELQTTSTDGKVDSSCTKPLFYFLLMPAPGSRQMQTTFLSAVPSDGTSARATTTATFSAELGI
jgi:hypothetical protein